MKKIAWITLILGYIVLATAPENASDGRIISAMILFGSAGLLGLQVYKTELGKKD